MTRNEMLEKLIPAIRILDAGAVDLIQRGHQHGARHVHDTACGLQEVAEALLAEMKEAE